APKALLTIPRNRCSRSSEISAHDPLKSALTIPRNAHADRNYVIVCKFDPSSASNFGSSLFGRI
ncbi:hypothetical protein, partial [Bradyrhizobium sp. Mp27]|uniref:hypothetical protein n=1 Tax=Bradyrhizobium sp. Mp27 TaxID=3042157 RepID=UPI00248CA002